MGLGLIRLGLELVPLGLVFGVCWLGLCFGLLRFVPLLNFGLYICVRLGFASSWVWFSAMLFNLGWLTCAD